MIRRAETRDIPDILELLVQVCMVHHNGRPDLFKGPATKYTAEELATLVKDDTRPIFVLTDEADARVLGYAFCIFQQHLNDNILTDVRTLYIDDLVVRKQYRGRHLGKQLYEYVKKFSRESGCHNLTLNVWAFNENARKFYESLGMKPQKIFMEEILDEGEK